MFIRRAIHLLLVGLLVLGCSGNPQRLPPKEVERLDAKLDHWYPAGEPGAVVLLVRRGETLYQSARGLADVDRHRPLTMDMPFRIGSLTKQFTAAAVLKLVEEGKLRLQDPISAYFDRLPTGLRAITIEQLLTHTSGLPDYTERPAYQESKGTFLSPDEIWRRYIPDGALDFSPGSRFKYSNSGYLLLGMVIEKVSGMSYPAFLQAQFLTPLGLTHTYYDDHVEQPDSMPSGYLDPTTRATSVSISSEGAAFGLVSTATDLVRWSQALHAGRVLAPSSLSRMLSPVRMVDGSAGTYGCGLSLRTSQGHTLAGHSGRVDGFTAFLETDLQTGAVAVILSNTSELRVDLAYFSRYLLALAAGSPLQDLQPAQVPLSSCQRIRGLYAVDKEIRVVSFREGKVFSRKFGFPRFEMLPISESEFGFKDSDQRFRFERSGDSITGCRQTYGDEPASPFQPRLEAVSETFPIAERRVRGLCQSLQTGVLDPTALEPGLIRKISPSRAQAMTEDLKPLGGLQRMVCHQRLSDGTGRTRYVYRLGFEHGESTLMLWLNARQRISEFRYLVD